LVIGVIGLALTASIQAGIYIVSGSVALLADTLHNGIDLLGTAGVWLAFRLVGRGRSERFTFGYHRFEDLAAAFVALLIAASAILVFWEGIRALIHDSDVYHPWAVLAGGLVGAAGNETVALYKIRVGKRIGSLALEADGRHSRADGLTSLAVVVAAVGLLIGQGWMDAAAGLTVGMIIARSAYITGRDSFLRLLDGSDPELREYLLKRACDIEQIEHVNDLRVRHSGRTVHVVASVCMAGSNTLEQAHETADELRECWSELLPIGSPIDIHVDPYEPGPEHVDSHHAGIQLD
jgi:cation diffusion facilitator family transporter